MRAFIAIDIEPEIKTALQAFIRGLQSTRADIRWVSEGGMHLTLKFLGPVDDDQAVRIKGILAGVARRHAAFPLRLERTGAFPGEKSPRVLWVGVASEPALVALQDEIDSALEAEGFERERRAFTPHLTIGRIKGPDRVGRAMVELEKHGQESFGAMTVRKIALFESLLRPEGAEYKIVYEAGLS